MSYDKYYPNGWQSGEAGGTAITPEALDHIEKGVAGALPKDGSDSMAGDLPMGGHKVTGLGTPTADGDAVPLGYANQNFAPAGFGLGNSSPKTISGIDALDAAMANGWYYVTGLGGSSFGGVMVVQGLLLVIGKDSYHTRHYFYPADSDVVLYRARQGEVWGEWCCKNPPMSLGVEYRTTERWNGKVVYTQRISLGTVAVGDNVISYGISGITSICGLELTDGNGFFVTNHPNIVNVWSSLLAITVTAQWAQALYATLRYTKD